jgi:serine/threonine protein kinase
MDLSAAPIIHAQPSLDLDPHHEVALNTLLKDCSDDQLLAEIARRRLDVNMNLGEQVVKDLYKFERVLGEGASGQVQMVRHKKTGVRYAMKVIKKDGGMNDADSMGTELEIMKVVRHKNIVCLHELFESSSCIWLILELVQGSDLTTFISSMKHYSESLVAPLFAQILRGVHYLHSQGIVHRDLKLDNIMLHGDVESEGALVKLVDFGLSAFIREKGYPEESSKRKNYRGLKEMWGTATYFAPELIDGAYGPQADVWSLGCILYEMLSGLHPFHGKDDHALYSHIKSGFVDTHSPPWDEISAEAKDLVKKLLTVDPVERISCTEALGHPWLTGACHNAAHQAHIGSAHQRIVSKSSVKMPPPPPATSGEGCGKLPRKSIWSFLTHRTSLPQL